jgi:membrane AbrB-like protein
VINFGLFLLTIAVGVLGAFFARKAKIPAGGMVGAMVLVMAFNLLTQKGFFYDGLRTVVQIGSGAMIGSSMKREHIKALKSLILPMIILWVFMLIMNLTAGGLIIALTDMDPATAFFASSPGGMADMALIASEMGANPAYVAVLHLIRILTIIIFMPPIYKKIGAKAPETRTETAVGETAAASGGNGRIKQAIQLLTTVAIGTVGGLLFAWLGVPAGAMIGSMLFVAAFSALADKAYYPSPLRNYTQIAAGIYVGMRMDRASFMTLPDLILPALILIISVFIFAFLTGYVMHKATKVPLCTALMASTPGGLQEMSILADDLGMDAPTIALFHTSRMMFVIAIFPTMLKLIVTYLL